MRIEPVRTFPLLASQATAPTTAQPAAGTEQRSQSFQPVEGGGELRSGELLLVEAYAAIWAIVLVFILLSWRRQQRIDARVDALEGAIERARRGSGQNVGSSPQRAKTPSKGAS
jgi:hypothetical protein